MKIELVIGDITEQPDLDAVVNAANSTLCGGGGVDGAIHRAAGPQLLDAVIANIPTIAGGNMRCPTGHAIVTPAFNLPNDYIIHTVGPIYKDIGALESSKYLNAAYHNSLVVGINEGCESIGFPAIGTGIYGYPLEDATVVAVRAVLATGRSHSKLTVRFVCFDEANFLVYKRVLEAVNHGWEELYIFD